MWTLHYKCKTVQQLLLKVKIWKTLVHQFRAKLYFVVKLCTTTMPNIRLKYTHAAHWRAHNTQGQSYSQHGTGLLKHTDCRHNISHDQVPVSSTNQLLCLFSHIYRAANHSKCSSYMHNKCWLTSIWVLDTWNVTSLQHWMSKVSPPHCKEKRGRKLVHRPISWISN